MPIYGFRRVATLHCFCSNDCVIAAKKRPPTEILIFDVDGVLVDVRGTYWRSALETVRYITGKRVTYAELHRWKSKPGFNRSEERRVGKEWRAGRTRERRIKRVRR